MTHPIARDGQAKSNPSRVRKNTAALLFTLLPLLAACSNKLIPTPYAAYGEEGKKAFAQTPVELQTADIPVLYVTDRVVDKQSPKGPVYGYKRGRDMAFGEATVSVGKGITWEQLVADSTGPTRSHSYHPAVSKVVEVGTLKSIITKLMVENGNLRFAHDALAKLQEEQKPFNDLLTKWLDRANRKEVLVFIHGYNNKFDDAILRLAEAWHFGGRQGVPIVYTWPAGSGGLKGYAYDRESGEFTTVHLKRLLVLLALHPGVERVHIISHSRGTDVALTAVRELHNEVRGALRNTPLAARAASLEGDTVRADDGDFDPTDTASVLKLATFILAAPDLDLEVFIQRFFGENVVRAARRVVVYFSKEDEALGLADWLFRSKRRLGAMRIEDFPESARPMLAQLKSLELINTRVRGHTTHSYILQHPAALSDLMRLIADGTPAGTERRPLKRPTDGLWELENDYLKPDKN
jgi:esterase/lipase superfamily enzyme